MSSKKKRILIIASLAIFLCIGLSVFLLKNGFNNLHTNIIEPTSFLDIIFEKDTSEKSEFPLKNEPIDTSITDTSINIHNKHRHSSHLVNHRSKSIKQGSNQSSSTEIEDETTSIDTPPSNTTEVKKGREIKSSEIPLIHNCNARIRLMTLLTTFKQGDYITGVEFSNLYKRDPSINKLAKTTLCGFIENHISQLTRMGNAFVIETIDPKGIHTKIKIPFVEDFQINIDNGAQLVIGDAFTSTAPGFSKSILLPIQFKSFDIIHNGDRFPKSGYVSGDFYFIDYDKTKMAYKIR